MILTQAAEIIAHLEHNDISLAVRRMLDLSLESGNRELMKESITWSRNLHNQPAEDKVDAAFLQQGYALVEKAKQLKTVAGPAITELVQADNISKRYQSGNFSLKPVSMKISNGQITGVVGENGNGKTTLLRCLAGQLAIDNGQINYSLLKNPDYYDVKNYVAFIPQRIPKWYGLLKDNLHFSASIAGVKGEENELIVDFMLERLGLAKYAMLTWSQISSGYRTRFELARILLQKPQLLILDEPLANLDIKAQQTVLTDLKFLARSSYNPLGIILSSQQLHEVEKVADDVIFIKDGQAIYHSTSRPEQHFSGYSLEIETKESREYIQQVLAGKDASISFNGGFYTIVSQHTKVSEMISTIISSGMQVTYFRDITYSAKRYFN